MIKTVLKVNGMMCGMCEAHMNDLVRKNFQVKKVTSSVKDGETVVISEENLDIPFLKRSKIVSVIERMRFPVKCKSFAGIFFIRCRKNLFCKSLRIL